MDSEDVEINPIILMINDALTGKRSFEKALRDASCVDFLKSVTAEHFEETARLIEALKGVDLSLAIIVS